MKPVHADVLDIVAVKGIDCQVYVSSLSELSSYHCPIQAHVETQYFIVRDKRRLIDWESNGPAFRRRLPEQVPFDTIQHVVALLDEHAVSAINVSSRMKLGLMLG